jgi:hypothetical protein
MKKKQWSNQRSIEHKELLDTMEGIHERALAPNPSQAAPASPQSSLMPATDQLQPAEERHAPLQVINRRLSFDAEQQQEESPGPQFPLSPCAPHAISDAQEECASIGDGQVVEEAGPPPDACDRECGPGRSPSPQPSPPPSPRYWESRRCGQLEMENQRFRIMINTVQAELRQTQVDLLDAESEVSELFDKARYWMEQAARFKRHSDQAVAAAFRAHRPDMYAGYENGKVVYVWDRNRR